MIHWKEFLKQKGLLPLSPETVPAAVEAPAVPETKAELLEKHGLSPAPPAGSPYKVWKASPCPVSLPREELVMVDDWEPMAPEKPHAADVMLPAGHWERVLGLEQQRTREMTRICERTAAERDALRLELNQANRYKDGLLHLLAEEREKLATLKARQAKKAARKGGGA